ncbi:MAG TPA: PLP-dependent aminotransferase family protein [Pseudacidobacterium sp.]|nr:PLP-dependent aminotransferase family protein [Pseudacidobacterium sp.]
MSDVSAGILPVIAIDRQASHPLHRQIYDGFRAAVLRNDLRPGQQIPSSRALAIELKISRFPVLDAYSQLLAEGYFESRVGSGTFISSSLPQQRVLIPHNSSNPKRANSRPVSHRSLVLPGFEQSPWGRGWGAFGIHQPALEHFPFEVWSRLVARHSRRPPLGIIHHVDPMGLEHVRDAISAYLRTSRAVRCDPRQIMIVSGSQQALDITARVLLDPGDPVWIENPGYSLTRAVLIGLGCRLVPVPVDQEGLNVAAGIKQHRRARAAFVAPSHQYPLGVTMSASRRLQLLNWAESSGAWIIEDDYDSEFRYESMPIASLQGLDLNSRVIYIGTFSKVLFPSVRLGYIVIPPDLIDRFMAVRFAMDIFPSYLYQEVLADFMNAGHFARHIRKMRALYQTRRTALVNSIRKEFGDRLDILGTQAGMHLVVTLPEGIRDIDVATAAAKQGLWTRPLSLSYVRGKPRQGFILGFGSASDEEIPRAVHQMRILLRNVSM